MERRAGIGKNPQKDNQEGEEKHRQKKREQGRAKVIRPNREDPKTKQEGDPQIKKSRRVLMAKPSM